jgi:hypothetical protein
MPFFVKKSEELFTDLYNAFENDRKGNAKFEFGAIDNQANIITYHIKQGRRFWQMFPDRKEKIIVPYQQPDRWLSNDRLINPRGATK